VVNGLAAMLGSIGGNGGLVSGLAAMLGSIGGNGGVVSGLAATLGSIGGNGGLVSGLLATLGSIGGNGGLVNGLATAKLATAAIPATKTKLRTLTELVIHLRSLTTVGTMQVKSNPKVSYGLQQK
jgi:hypothetical protein